MSHGTRRKRPVVAVMTRFPRPGAVKTRLAPMLGPDGAAELHRRLAAHCVSRLRPLQATGEAQVEVHFEGGSARECAGWLGAWPRFVRQAEGDLGGRLKTALSGALASGAPSALVVGSDCPAARATHVREAIRLLDMHEMVIGPAEDGGYWLLGVRTDAAHRALSAIFEDIEWGGVRVFEETLVRAKAASLRVTLADRLADVDRPEDLPTWEAEYLSEQRLASVSVIIPALNEAAHVVAAVRSAFEGGAREVIVVDGGSTDGTGRLAETAGAELVHAPRGRAGQMNVGARVATGDALVFLHADTRLPADSAALVLDALSVDDAVGGAFTWGTDDAPMARFFNWAGRTRGSLFRVPYGDQALFLRRQTFEDLGGYPAQPVMEDWELAQRLRRLGDLRILPEHVLTSSRRWKEGGIIRPSIAYLAIIAGYRFGIDPTVLDGWRQA